MERRQALQLLMGSAAFQLASPTLFASLRSARILLDTQTTLRTLDPQQNATVTAMAETILPKADTVGAAEAGASQFVDLILTEWYTQSEREIFLNGLADVDTRTHSAFGKSFVECSADQRSRVLTDLGEQLTKDTETARNGAPGYRGSYPKPNKNFYYMMRNLTLTAYYTSEVVSQPPTFQVNPDR
ncbi:MAG TPA: gluconate 2-dehydrogenase subunit 3 family protein [Terriglobales bacterium]|nr:gluconate 2-dehydrogenase subunit 3 family protein [Terriglobales bacterium]